ncbi:MAG TPA: aminopeptidase [Cyclobacteriaceae bacterium]|nr:aminopeptidase [Cyclobacteriaceae bacterium]
MQKKAGKIIKRSLLALLLIIIALVIIYWELVVYGFRQGKGQFTIIWNARPVEEVLKDPSFPDSLKAKLHLIERVRQYAIDSLGLKDTENYKTLYDQKGEEIMWVVTACEPFQFKPKEWKFPILGSVPYKGFFIKEKAIELRNELEKEGWDTSIRNPGGWSTLGWFTDPILSGMLERSEGDLANLIIHEMVHATIFVKDSVDFNENLATFIGDRGTEKFLVTTYGDQSKEYADYIQLDVDFTRYSNHMLRGTEMLDSLYKTMKENDPVEVKKKLKSEAIQKIVYELDTLTLLKHQKPSERFRERLPNNTYFINMKRYQEKQDTFWKDYNANFKGDLKYYIRYLSEKYPFL